MAEMTSEQVRKMSNDEIAARLRMAAELNRTHQAITYEHGISLVNIVAIHGDRLAAALASSGQENLDD